MRSNAGDSETEMGVSGAGGAIPLNRQLPLAWRPRQARIVVYALVAAVVVTMLVLAVILPENWRLTDRLLMVAFGGVLAWALSLLARPRITATTTGLTVVNLIRTRVLTWPEIIDARMPDGEPWVSIDLTDGTCLPAMGIQSADGARAWENLAELRGLVTELGESPGPDQTSD